MIRFEWLESLPFWPAQLSEHAVTVDTILVAFAVVLFLFALPVFVAMTWFSIKYHRSSTAERSGRPRSSPWLEAAWSAIPLAILLVFFVQAAEAFFALHRDVRGALQIDVVAKQWMWKFQHPSGRREINRLTVPVDTPVELTMISQDVIHSLYLPALRIKQDLLPGRYTTLRFEAERTGTYRLACAEFCGTLHSRMIGEIVVKERHAYEDWATRQDVFAPPELAGARLFVEGDCAACHGDGDLAAAPSLAGLYGSAVPLADGGAVRADEDYLRSSIVLPNRHIVAGYAPIMPSYQDLLDETEIRSLIAYIKSLQEEGGRR